MEIREYNEQIMRRRGVEQQFLCFKCDKQYSEDPRFVLILVIITLLTLNFSEHPCNKTNNNGTIVDRRKNLDLDIIDHYEQDIRRRTSSKIGKHKQRGPDTDSDDDYYGNKTPPRIRPNHVREPTRTSTTTTTTASLAHRDSCNVCGNKIIPGDVSHVLNCVPKQIQIEQANEAARQYNNILHGTPTYDGWIICVECNKKVLQEDYGAHTLSCSAVINKQNNANINDTRCNLCGFDLTRLEHDQVCFILQADDPFLCCPYCDKKFEKLDIRLHYMRGCTQLNATFGLTEPSKQQPVFGFIREAKVTEKDRDPNLMPEYMCKICTLSIMYKYHNIVCPLFEGNNEEYLTCPWCDKIFLRNALADHFYCSPCKELKMTADDETDHTTRDAYTTVTPEASRKRRHDNDRMDIVDLTTNPNGDADGDVEVPLTRTRQGKGHRRSPTSSFEIIVSAREKASGVPSLGYLTLRAIEQHTKNNRFQMHTVIKLYDTCIYIANSVGVDVKDTMLVLSSHMADNYWEQIILSEYILTLPDIPYVAAYLASLWYSTTKLLMNEAGKRDRTFMEEFENGIQRTQPLKVFEHALHVQKTLWERVIAQKNNRMQLEGGPFDYLWFGKQRRKKPFLLDELLKSMLTEMGIHKELDCITLCAQVYKYTNAYGFIKKLCQEILITTDYYSDIISHPKYEKTLPEEVRIMLDKEYCLFLNDYMEKQKTKKEEKDPEVEALVDAFEGGYPDSDQETEELYDFDVNPSDDEPPPDDFDDYDDLVR